MGPQQFSAEVAPRAEEPLRSRSAARHILVRIVQETRDGDAIVRAAAGGELVLTCAADTQLRREERLWFAPPCAGAPPVNLLLAVTSTAPGPNGLAVRGRCKALHTSGTPGQLVDFAVGVLGLPTPSAESLTRGSGGWFCRFEAPSPDGLKPLTGDASVVERRASPRVPVRMKLSYAWGGRIYSGTAYNISEDGLFVLTDKGSPAHGENVRVICAIPVHAGNVSLQIQGRVVWLMDGQSAGKSGFGILIEGFGASADGDLWRQHIQSELQFGGGVQVSKVAWARPNER
jgi:hypothetical protein